MVDGERFYVSDLFQCYNGDKPSYPVFLKYCRGETETMTLKNINKCKNILTHPHTRIENLLRERSV